MERMEQRRQRQMRRKKARQKLMIVSAMTLVIGLLLGSVVGNVVGKKALEKEVKNLTAELKEKNEAIETLQQNVELQENEEETELPWNLVLVNSWNEMEEGYVPELTEVEDGYQVDSRIVEPLKKMLADARAAGTSPIICSAYRSVDRQETLFNNGVQKRLNRGLNYYDAYVETATAIAIPGTSEHALGLAVDIVAASNQNLTEEQENTAEQKWLMENCYKYGFILRYPNGTTDITGIIYEPWHYRYVGVEIATEITELGITYEEYLEEYYKA